MASFIGRLRLLRFFMSPYEAVKMALNENKDLSFETRIAGVSHPIMLRGATSDIQCFQKVFINHEYSLPYNLGAIEPRVIIDAGANIGLATLYFATHYPGARIIAIEPEPSNFGMLKRNCAFLPNVTFVEGALWSSSGDLALTNSTDQPWTYAVTGQHPANGARKVKAYSMLDIIAIANADRIDLLKLDIEGSEKELFSQDSDRWLDRVSVIAIELHDRFKPGCSAAFYSQLIRRNFQQEARGENIFVKLLPR
jgi:FkbM family methyltransferase